MFLPYMTNKIDYERASRNCGTGIQPEYTQTILKEQFSLENITINKMPLHDKSLCYELRSHQCLY